MGLWEKAFMSNAVYQIQIEHIRCQYRTFSSDNSHEASCLDVSQPPKTLNQDRGVRAEQDSEQRRAATVTARQSFHGCKIGDLFSVGLLLLLALIEERIGDGGAGEGQPLAGRRSPHFHRSFSCFSGCCLKLR